MSLVRINLGKPATMTAIKEAKMEARLEARMGANLEAIMEAIMTATMEARLHHRNTAALTTREMHGEDDSVRH
jgi:hypothetical protein